MTEAPLPKLKPRPINKVAIDAEMEIPQARIMLVRYDLGGPGEYVIRGDKYRIDLCITPRPEQSRACYFDRWGPHRFERLGDVFLMPPDERFLVRGEAGRQITAICEFEPEALHQWLDGPPEWTDRKLEAMMDVPGGYIRTLLARMVEEARHPRYASDVLVGHMFGQLMIELARFLGSITDGPPTGGLSAWRLRLIDERLNDLSHTPSLEELAKLCNVSVRQLTRGFRTSRGCSIGDYVDQKRMEAAKRLLSTDESVKAIAFSLGFSSPSSFSYAFRRATGITPRSFRQRQGSASRIDKQTP